MLLFAYEPSPGVAHASLQRLEREVGDVVAGGEEGADASAGEQGVEGLEDDLPLVEEADEEDAKPPVAESNDEENGTGGDHKKRKLNDVRPDVRR